MKVQTMRSGRLTLCMICCLFLASLTATVANAAEDVQAAFIYPVDRVYPLVQVEVVPQDGQPSAEDWSKAFPGQGFFISGRIEKEGHRSTFRMLNPYNMQYQYTHKPVRCWTELKKEEIFILNIDVAPQ